MVNDGRKFGEADDCHADLADLDETSFRFFNNCLKLTIGTCAVTPLRISKVPILQHSKVAGEIEDALLNSLADLNEQSVNSSVVMTVNDDDGLLMAGISGFTSYGWFLVKLLWVSDIHRGSGVGKELMLAAEDEAKLLGCHSAWLDTSNSKAREFYLRLGYADFGVIENGSDKEPANHSRWFMKKLL